MRIQFIGSGDAFGNGGRFNACLLLETSETPCLVDCGASSLIAMKRLHVDPNSIRTILITHLHGDHFGSLPFFILDGQFARRSAPLTIAGPPGIRETLPLAMEIFFPGSSKTAQKFDWSILEWQPRQAMNLDDLTVTPYPVRHGRTSSFALRVETEERVVAYSGDTEWCDELAEAGRDADLFICEAYFYDKPIKFHLDLKTLESHLPAFRPKRLVLTHMGPDMLGREGLGYELAADGKSIEL